MSVVDDLVQARDAYARREWVAAYDGLASAGEATLNAEDYARLATAAYLLGHRNDCIQALQRAYRTHTDAGEVAPAVRCAYWLAKVLVVGGEIAVAGGWVARAQRLLDDHGDDLVERGYVLIHLMFQRIGAGDFPGAIGLAEEVEQYGRRFDDPDLLTVGLSARGRLLMYSGQVPQGLALLDEAMIGVTTGDVSPIFAGDAYCTLIEGCQEVADFARAAEWTTRLTRWCTDQPGLVPFTGQCAVHRGQIMKVRGALTEALAELDEARRRYERSGAGPAVALAWAERGDVLRLLGDLPGAEAAYEEARAAGHDPQPGLALLWLAQGRVEAAGAATRRLLAEPRDAVHRAQLLPAAAEVFLAELATDEAAAAVAELSEVAERFCSASLQAAAAFARGGLVLLQDRPADAAAEARAAITGWSRLDVPYEAARSRVLLGRAWLVVGDQESAQAELGAARSEFAAVGARRAERSVADLLGSPAPGGLTAREVEVLRLVAGGASNPEIARVPGAQREDGRAAPEQHLRQARRPHPDRRGSVRVRERPGRQAALSPAASALTPAQEPLRWRTTLVAAILSCSAWRRESHSGNRWSISV